MSDYLQSVLDKRSVLEKTEKQKKNLEKIVGASEDGSKKIIHEIVRQSARTRTTVQPVEIKNENLAKTEDAEKIVGGLNQLNNTAANSLTAKENLLKITEGISSSVESINNVLEIIKDKDNSEFDKRIGEATEELRSVVQKLNTIEVKVDDGLINKLTDVIDILSQIDFKPEVNVNVPEVHVPETKVDVEPIKIAIESLKEKKEDVIDLACFRAQDIDNDTTGFQFIGMVDNDGRWCIIQNDIDGGKLRYKLGKEDYTGAWDYHVQLRYLIWNEAVDEIQA